MECSSNKMSLGTRQEGVGKGAAATMGFSTQRTCQMPCSTASCRLMSSQTLDQRSDTLMPTCCPLSDHCSCCCSCCCHPLIDCYKQLLLMLPAGGVSRHSRHIQRRASITCYVEHDHLGHELLATRAACCCIGCNR